MTTKSQIKVRAMRAQREGRALQYAIMLSEFATAMEPRIVQLEADRQELGSRKLELKLVSDNYDAAAPSAKPDLDKEIKFLESSIRAMGRSLSMAESSLRSEANRWIDRVDEAGRAWRAAHGCYVRNYQETELMERNGEPARADTSPQQ